MGRINAEWHRAHPMPKRANLEQRIKWHLAHAKACACRELPASVARELKARGVRVPARRR